MTQRLYSELARYHDSFFSNDRIIREVAFIVGELGDSVPQGATVLELGCGTGRYLAELTSRGFVPCGIDIATSMLRIACERIAHLQPKHFSHFFHDKVGVTFTDWLSALRVERAAAMLKEQDYSVGQVAQAVGLRSQRTCERWFKRFTGVTPRQFKERIKPR